MLRSNFFSTGVCTWVSLLCFAQTKVQSHSQMLSIPLGQQTLQAIVTREEGVEQKALYPLPILCWFWLNERKILCKHRVHVEKDRVHMSIHLQPEFQQAKQTKTKFWRWFSVPVFILLFPSYKNATGTYTFIWILVCQSEYCFFGTLCVLFTFRHWIWAVI